jgi:hypothetical protein
MNHRTINLEKRSTRNITGKSAGTSVSDAALSAAHKEPRLESDRTLGRIAKGAKRYFRGRG